jgi:thymidylate kinase
MAPAVVLTHIEDPYASHWSCRARAPSADDAPTFEDHWTCRERPPPVSTPRKTFLARRAAAASDEGPRQPMRHPGVLALPQDKTLVNLEGNIGAGKSTLLRVLKAAYGGCSAVRFVDEPVAQWERAGLLAALYAGKMSPAAFQLTAMVTRAAALKEALADPFAKVIISERSLASDRAVFAGTQLSGADRDAYDLAYATIELPAVAATATVLLECPVEELTRRVSRRRRDGENHVSAEYLQMLESAHGRYFATLDRASRVDASAAPDDVARDVVSAINGLVAPSLPKPRMRSPTSVADLVDNDSDV